MRITISQKILIVYGLLLSFSLIQGILLYSVVEQFRSHYYDNELVRSFNAQIYVLEKLKIESSEYVEHGNGHIEFEEQFLIAKDSLAQMAGLNRKLFAEYADQLGEASTYLDNYHKAYFELHELVHKTNLLHTRGIQVFSMLEDRLSAMEPELAEKFFLVFMDHYTIGMGTEHSHNITLLPHLKQLQKDIEQLTVDPSNLAIVQEAIGITEASYLNSLAIEDRHTFLAGSAIHLTKFCDSVVMSMVKNNDRYVAFLKWIMTILVAAAAVLTMMLFWVSRRYFKKFLDNQQTAISAIENGNYDYPLPDLPRDELGDLATFMKGMADSLQKNEEEIRQSEEYVRLLLNSASEAIYGLDTEGKCTFCNDSFLRTIGYESENELLGKNMHDLIHHTKIDGSDYPWDECVAHRAFLDGKQTHSDNELFWHRDGSSFYAECWSYPIVQNEKVTGAVVTFLDITQRREALLALRNSEELYRGLIENIDLGITLIDRDHTIIMTNSAQGKMFARDALSFQGKKCFSEFEKRDHVCGHCPGIAAMDTGEAQEVFAQGVKDDGSSFTVRIKAFPVYREGNEAFGFIEVVEDVTDKLQAEKNLAAEKEQLSVTLRSIGDGVITTDTEGRVVLVNRVAEELCGWSQQEAQGRSLIEIFQIVNEVTGKSCDNPMEKVLDTGQVVALANHTTLISRDGTRRSIADSGAAIRDRDSEIVGVVLVFRDVTEEKRREKELLKTQKLESIGVLAGGIAHDFNNILSAILGNINLVRHIISPTERKAHTFLEEAENASIRAKNLTQQLLTFSKGGEPLMKAASISDIIRDSTTFVLRGTDIKYELDIPEDIWPVDADPGQISQVVQNIVLNARHSMPRGGILQVSCSNISSEQDRPALLQKNRKYVMVSIADSGIGIPANVIDNIFDPYFSTKREGSGLGLSICHSIINKHQGHISVQSEQGEGTVFTFYLPTSSKAVAEKEPEHLEKVFSMKGVSVLIMDDDEQIRTTADAMLSHLGCISLQAIDGEEAVELYKSSLKKGKQIDVVIVDLTIPGGMGGKDALAEILQFDPRARVIVSSGYSNDPIMAKYQEYGFCATIVKPYLLEDLVRAIEEALTAH